MLNTFRYYEDCNNDSRILDLVEQFASEHNGKPKRPPISEITRWLNIRISSLAHTLLGSPNKGRPNSTELRYGKAERGKTGALSIKISGPKQGRWFDHKENVGGDALRLISHVYKIPTDRAITWAIEWLGLDDHASTQRKRARPHVDIDKTEAATATLQPSADVHADRSVNYRSANDDSDSHLMEDDEAERAAKIDEIIGSTICIAGTAGELYLRSRGITASLPDCIGFRPDAYRQYGALVAFAKDLQGEILAVHQVYLTDLGKKAPLDTVKRTNGVSGWAEKAAFRLPGKAPVILAEGVETALSIWQATGQETWACLGISNVAHAPVPDGADVVIARDGDEPGGTADRTIQAAATALVRRGHSVSMASPPRDKDFNDVLVKEGEDAVRHLIGAAGSVAGVRDLEIGSDVEVSQRVLQDLMKEYGNVVQAEGSFWRFSGTHWEPMEEHELRRAVHAYDGAHFSLGGGKTSLVKLGKARIDSILNECAMLCADPRFFEIRPTGINCATGFIRFAGDGTPSIEAHDRDHRCRHTLPGHWKVGSDGSVPEGSLMRRLLYGVFKGDDDAAEKVALLSEVCGAAALGCAKQLLQPKAVILFGQSAENGKSQILDLARGLLPPSAVCSVPAGRMGDERHIVGLVGKLLNASDELSAAAISSDIFKSIVTGEPVGGRDVYKSRIEFQSMAQNLFATNSLPPFSGGMDRGVQRRLLVITFNRTIPMEDRIENIGGRIARDEGDVLLAWAVEGASRLIKQRNFTLPPSSKQALSEWLYGADPVLAWAQESLEVVHVAIVGKDRTSVTTRSAFNHFRAWAAQEGFRTDKLPAIRGFVQRVVANVPGVEYQRTATGRFFVGAAFTQTARLLRFSDALMTQE